VWVCRQKGLVLWPRIVRGMVVLGSFACLPSLEHLRSILQMLQLPEQLNSCRGSLRDGCSVMDLSFVWSLIYLITFQFRNGLASRSPDDQTLKVVLILPAAMLVPNALWLQENEQNMHVEFCKFVHFSIFNCN
jgi:hypothetical protein